MDNSRDIPLSKEYIHLYTCISEKHTLRISVITYVYTFRQKHELCRLMHLTSSFPYHCKTREKVIHDIQSYIHTDIQTYKYTVFTHIHVYVYIFVCVYIHIYTCICMRVCVCLCNVNVVCLQIV